MLLASSGQSPRVLQLRTTPNSKLSAAPTDKEKRPKGSKLEPKIAKALDTV